MKRRTVWKPSEKQKQQAAEYVLKGWGHRNWYDDVARTSKDYWGALQPIHLLALAVTSENTSVRANATLAHKLMEALLYWGPPRPETGWESGIEPLFMGRHLDNFRRGWDGEPLYGDKLCNFYAALRGLSTAIPVDRWMLTAYGLPFKTKKTSTILLAIKDHVIETAATLGIQPRQAQAACWAGMRMVGINGQPRRAGDTIYDFSRYPQPETPRHGSEGFALLANHAPMLRYGHF